MVTTENYLSNSPKWYALYTTPRAEKQVEQRLKSEGVTVFLPKLTIERKWSDRIKVIETPMFNSYIFVKVYESQLPILNKIGGVVKTVYFCGRPAIVQEKEINAIKKYIAKAGVCELIPGDQVEIICGALSTSTTPTTGKIIKVGKDKLLIQLPQLGAKVCIKRSQVKKQPL